MKVRREKKSVLIRALTVVMLFAAALAAVALAVRSEQEGGLEAVWDSITGRRKAEEFYYDNASDGAFADMKNGLAVMSGSELRVYSRDGELSFSRLFTYSSPAMHVSGDYGAAYDVGGRTVIFFSDDGVICDVVAENPIVSAYVNSKGYLAVSAEDSGYFGSVTIYNSNGTAIYRWMAGSARVLSARVQGSERFIALTVGEGGSRIVQYALSSEGLDAEYTADELILDAVFTEDGVIAVTTGGLIGLDEKLQESWRYDFEGKYLAAYDIFSGGAALALSNFQVGGGGTLVALSASGKELGSAGYSGDIVSLDASKDGTAALISGKVSVFDGSMKLRTEFEADAAAERVIMRSDGVMCAGAFSARLHTV